MTPERWRRVEEIFQTAMDRDPQSRRVWVEGACGPDDELKREVASLLALDSHASIVDKPAWDIAADLMAGEFDLPPGTRFGPYRIEATIGSGGMGSVYRAVDTRLHRSVAIKVCDTEFNQRFEREARAVGALNHPNVCTLHDVGPNYLVMELIEGPTLADRIRQGPIAVPEAIGIARQISSALEIAHERGIIHRDLKPSNVKLTSDGVAKVLDFGLAQMRGNSDLQGSDLPTMTVATESGTVLGTAPYMSPEQVRGQPLDKRTDIWSFGVVLYEMLTGRRPFAGETSSDVMASILTEVPDWEPIPVEIRPVLQACLEKDPKQRLRDIGDAWRLLDSSDNDGPVKPGRFLLRATVGAVAVLACGAAVASWGWWHARQRPANLPIVLNVDLGQSAPSGLRSGSDVILSPDGTRLVFVARDRLFTRRLEEPNATELPGTEHAFGPFFSPDGQWVGFFAEAKLKKILLSAGTVEIVCDVGLRPRGGSWGDDGTIVLALDNTGPLSRVAAGGGRPATVTQLEGEYGTHRWPQVLPGSKAILFTTHASPLSGFDEAGIAVLNAKDQRQKILVRGGMYGRYVPTGHLLYVKGGVLFGVPFDLNRLEVRGKPVRIFDGVAYSNAIGSAQFDVASAGTLIYRTGGTERVRLEWLEASGATRPLLPEAGEFRYPTISPGGDRVAFVMQRGPNQELWTYDWQRDIRSRLTQGQMFNTNPCWSASGRYVLYQVPAGMAWVAADGSGASGTLLRSEPHKKLLFPSSFAPDGGRLAYYAGLPDLGGFDLWTVPVEEGASGLRAGNPEPFLRTPSNEVHPTFSPDGHWIAYGSNESGIFQVYVVSYPDKSRKVQVSSDGGDFMVWSHVRHELFFRGGDNRIMVAAYEVKDGLFLPHKARVWSETRLGELLNASRNFSMSADGTRAAVLMPAEAAQPAPGNHVVFVLNFFDDLRRRMRD